MNDPVVDPIPEPTPCSDCCGAVARANKIRSDLLAGENITKPTFDPNDPAYNIQLDIENIPVDKIEPESITNDTKSGVFDVMMAGIRRELSEELKANRITNADYAKILTSMLEMAMGNSVQFLLGKGTAFWEAQRTRINAVTAMAEMAQNKIKASIMLADFGQAENALAKSKMDLALAEAQYCTAKFDLEMLKPLEKEQATATVANTIKQGLVLDSEVMLADKKVAVVSYELTETMPAQKAQIVAATALTSAQKDQTSKQTELSSHELMILRPLQAAGITTDNSLKDFELTKLMPVELQKATSAMEFQKAQTEGQTLANADRSYKNINQNPVETQILNSQKENLTKDVATKTYNLEQLMPTQKKLLDEQVESQRAQTQNVRTDLAPVEGVLGQQRKLYEAQIGAYVTDGKFKVAKLYTDVWSVARSGDSQLPPPTEFANTNIDARIGALASDVGLK